MKVRILPFSTTFMQVYIIPRNFLLGSSLAFNLKDGPVRCATVCNKSWVILGWVQQLPFLPLWYLRPCDRNCHGALLRRHDKVFSKLKSLGLILFSTTFQALIQINYLAQLSSAHLTKFYEVFFISIKTV